MKGQDGLFKCSIHDESFDDIDEYYKHEQTVPHHRTIKQICSKCGSNGEHIEFGEVDVIPVGKLIPEPEHHLCPSCEAKQQQIKEARKQEQED